LLKNAFIGLHFQSCSIHARGISYTDPVISSLALEAKTMTMVTIMKALKELVEEESKFLVKKKVPRTWR
jgi:hypothetical protein